LVDTKRKRGAAGHCERRFIRYAPAMPETIMASTNWRFAAAWLLPMAYAKPHWYEPVKIILGPGLAVTPADEKSFLLALPSTRESLTG
jgi:hypothetical protein